MQWTQAALDFGVITMGASALCGLAGFTIRARIERRIRCEYRELFGACRRSMMQGNEYAARRAQSLETRKTTEFRPPNVRRPGPEKSTSVHRQGTVERDLSALARGAEPDFVRVLTTEVEDA